MSSSLISNYTLQEIYFGSTLKTKANLYLVLLLWFLAFFEIGLNNINVAIELIKDEFSLGYARLKDCVINLFHIKVRKIGAQRQSHFWQPINTKPCWKYEEKSWTPFRIYQLTSTANRVIICEVGLDWLCTVNVLYAKSTDECLRTKSQDN